MIAKINIGSNLYGALSYNQEKVNVAKGKVLGANLVNEPQDGQFNVVDCMRDFMSFVPSHFRTEKPVFHVSINPHPDDRLTDDQLTDIGREYMEKLGYGNQPYIIFKHEDLDRQHIHIVSLRVDSEGKKINDKKEHERSKAITEEIERKYDLHPAEGQKRSENWELSKVDAAKGDLKKQIAAVIKPIASMYHFQSMGEYKAILSLYNINVEELKGEANGKPYRGLLYSVTDTEGNKVGTPLKSSIFGKSVGYGGLEKRMEKSAEKIKSKNLKTHTLKAVTDARNNSSNESEFRAQLQRQGIDVLIRRNNDNRIYGVTFIDHTTRTALNGSRLGKEFSANAFNNLYGEIQSTTVLETNAHAQLADVYKTATNETNNLFDYNTPSSGQFAFFSIEPTGNNDKKSPFARKKKKKKRRYGRQQ